MEFSVTPVFQTAVDCLRGLIPDGHESLEVDLTEYPPTAVSIETTDRTDGTVDVHEHPVELTDEQESAAVMIGAYMEYRTHRIRRRFDDEEKVISVKSQLYKAMRDPLWIDWDFGTLLVKKAPYSY
ncbi:hypothetical protein [Frankia sp. KB5]|uniref:hypothetical protein n=1 Tax=Frankia sp. KB5 TaxID=683318 RepID=UPI001054C468|nr:hypothetical protein [Frankia sp. KB5]